MIDSIEFVDFQGLAECKALSYQSKEGFLKINYKFGKGNVYGFISDFGCGGWGAATCLSGRCVSIDSGKILLNEQEVLPEVLRNHSCFISENLFSGVNSENDLLTPRLCIEKALSLSELPYSPKQIKEVFKLSDARFDRPLNYVSGEIWLISAAINFALGKDIFCYPWLNMITISRFEIAKEQGIIDFLKKENKIILIPSSQKKSLRKYCDHTLCFTKRRIIYN